MIGKLSTCDCILNIDPITQDGGFLEVCDHHAKLQYTAQEVMAEHIAMKMHKTRHNPVVRLRRLFH